MLLEPPEYWPSKLEGVPRYPAVRLAWTKEGAPWPSAASQAIHSNGSIRQFCAELSRSNAVSSTWAEFGVENGLSARYFLTKLPADGQLLLYDSFEGLPEPWQGRPVGSHRAVAVPEFGDKRVHIRKGWFEGTLPCQELLGLVHIDCDLYSSTKAVLEGINVAPGTIILFDELFGFADWQQHEYKALMEWPRAWRFVAQDDRYRAAIEVP